MNTSQLSRKQLHGKLRKTPSQYKATSPLFVTLLQRLRRIVIDRQGRLMADVD